MTRVLPLPAPARIRTGPSVVSTASRCWGLRPERKSTTSLFSHWWFPVRSGVFREQGAAKRTLENQHRMSYRKLASLDELPEGSLLDIVQGPDLYVLCNVAGDVRAMSGVCPHHGGPLGQGALEGTFVTCPWHAWQFDSATGACAFNGDLRIPTYPVRIEAGQVLVVLPDNHA